MKISATVDASQVVAVVSNVARQLPYALNSAITRTAKEAVTAAQNEATAELQLRKRFILNRIKILQYSKVGNLTAIIGVDDKVQGSPLLLGLLEEGGTKQPTRGPDLAIPLTGEAARPAFPDSVLTALRYTNLQFENRKGKKKTFLIPGVGIFQRVAPGESPDATQLIYSFKPSAPLPHLLHLRAAMIEVIGRRFAPIFTEEFAQSILKRAEHIGG
jgi:hypothetical protein